MENYRKGKSSRRIHFDEYGRRTETNVRFDHLYNFQGDKIAEVCLITLAWSWRCWRIR